jgi:hypothetical protein
LPRLSRLSALPGPQNLDSRIFNQPFLNGNQQAFPGNHSSK